MYSDESYKTQRRNRYQRTKVNDNLNTSGTKNILNFSEWWNSVISFFLKPNKFHRLSDFHAAREELFNENKHESENNNISQFLDKENAFLSLEPKEELYFPLPFANVNFNINDEQSISNELPTNSFQMHYNLREIFKNINSNDLKCFEQNTTLGEKSGTDLCECKTERSPTLNFSHGFNNFLTDCDFCTTKILAIEDSSILQSSVSSENGCGMQFKKRRYGGDSNFAPEKSSANIETNDFNFANVNDNTFLFGIPENDLKNCKDINSALPNEKIISSTKCSNFIKKLDHVNYKQSYKNIYCDNDSGYSTTGIQNIPKFCDSMCKFDMEILNSISTSSEVDNETAKTEIIANEETDMSPDVRNHKNSKSNEYALCETAESNISEVNDQIRNFDQEPHNKICLQTESSKNYSVIKNIENCLKSGRKFDFSGIHQCFLNYFHIQDKLIRSTVNPIFDEILFAKLEENMDCYKTDFNMSEFNNNIEHKKVENENDRNKITFKNTNLSECKNCERLIRNTDHKVDNKDMVDISTDINAQTGKNFSSVENMMEMSKNENDPFVQNTMDINRKYSKNETFLIENCKTDADYNCPSYSEQKQSIFSHDLEHFPVESMKVLETAGNFENESTVLNVMQTPLQTVSHRKHLKKNNFVSSRKSRKYKYKNYFHINKRKAKQLETLNNSKICHNLNVEQNKNTVAETANKNVNDACAQFKNGNFSNIMSNNCEINDSKKNITACLENKVNCDSAQQSDLHRNMTLNSFDTVESDISNYRTESDKGNRRSKPHYNKQTVNKNKINVLHNDSISEKEIQANMSNMKSFMRISPNELNILIKSLNETESEIDFIKSQTSSSFSSANIMETNKEKILYQILNMKCKCSCHINTNNILRNVSNSKSTQNHFCNKISGRNINLYDTISEDNITSLKDKYTPYEIRKKLASSNIMPDFNSRITTQRSKLRMNIQYNPKSSEVCPTPILIQLSRTQTVSQIQNYNLMNRPLSEILDKKSEGEFRKIINNCLEQNGGNKLSESDYSSRFQYIIPDFPKKNSPLFNENVQLSNRMSSPESEILSDVSGRKLEKYHTVKSRGNDNKYGKEISRKAKLKSSQQLQLKCECMHHCMICKTKYPSVKASCSVRNNFLSCKEKTEMCSSDFKQHTNARKRRNTSEFKLDLKRQHHLYTFNSQNRKYCINGTSLKNKCQTSREPEYNSFCSMVADNDYYFSHDESSKSFAECEKFCTKRSRKREKIWYPPSKKSKFIQKFYEDELVTLDDLSLQSRLKSIKKASSEPRNGIGSKYFLLKNSEKKRRKNHSTV